MKTWEAMRCLEEGKKVRRRSWEELNDYIYLNKDGNLMHSNGTRYRLEKYITRDDWELYDDRK